MYERQRSRMVKKYVEDAGIEDERIMNTMKKIPRHLFVDPALAHQAYLGKALPIGFGQTISHPTTVAYMTQALRLAGDEKVLEIGTGSGYQAALLAEVGANVFTIERIPQLAYRARLLFEQLGYFSIAVHIGDGSLGWSAHAPYHRIIVTAASPEIPDALLKQLAEGGRMIVPIGNRDEQVLMILDREGDKITATTQPVHTFVPLIGKKGWVL